MRLTPNQIVQGRRYVCQDGRITGHHLSRTRDPLRITPAGYAVLVFLALAMWLSVAGLTVRALSSAEHQHTIERV
jgi:hypothetical protein